MENFIISKLNSHDEKTVNLWNNTTAGKKNPLYYPKSVKRLTFGFSRFDRSYFCLEQDEFDLESVNSSEITHIIVVGVKESNVEECIERLGVIMKDQEAWGCLYSIQFFLPKENDEVFTPDFSITEITGDSKSLGLSTIETVISFTPPYTLYVLEDNETWLVESLQKRGNKGYYFRVKERVTYDKKTLFKDEILVYKSDKGFYSCWSGRLHSKPPLWCLEDLIVVTLCELRELKAEFKNIFFFPSVAKFSVERWRRDIKVLMEKYAFGSLKSINRKYYKGKANTHLEIYHTL